MPVAVPWSRLIRFISKDDGKIYYGDAIIPEDNFDVGNEATEQLLKARIVEGDNPLTADCRLTSEIHSVKKVLGPLPKNRVPDIRCIAGNYKSHCMEFSTLFFHGKNTSLLLHSEGNGHGGFSNSNHIS